MALVGWDRARVLGHTLTRGYLVARQGSVVRRTVALQRSGVIGWRVRQSPFQRRAGVVTVEAVTAAGGGAYAVLDVAPADAVALMAAVDPAGRRRPAHLSRPGPAVEGGHDRSAPHRPPVPAQS